MARGSRARCKGVACAIIVAAAVFILLGFLAGSARAADGYGTNGVIPDLTKTPSFVPPLGGPLETPTPKPTDPPPCSSCDPRETPAATYAPAPTLQTAPNETLTPAPVPPTGQPAPPDSDRAAVSLRPILQFGNAQPGGMAMYTQIAANRLATPVALSVRAASLGDWPLGVVPDRATLSPGAAIPMSLTVSVPLNPTYLLDVEQIELSSGGRSVSSYMITFVGRHPFMDVSPNHWADGYVQYLAATGVVSGYSDGTFRPDDRVTRAQFTKMLVGAMGWTLVSPASPTFRDVPSGHWAYRYVETAAAHGLVSGYSDGTFRPDGLVLRAQVAKMIVIARGWEGRSYDSPGGFSDVRPGDWVFAYAQVAASARAMSGYSDGTFRPYQPATRAQIAKIVTMSLFSDPGN